MDLGNISLSQTVQRTLERLPSDVQSFAKSLCDFKAIESARMWSAGGYSHKKYLMHVSQHAKEVDIAGQIASKWLEHNHDYLTWSGYDKNHKECMIRRQTRTWGFIVLPTETDILLERLRKCVTISDHRAIILQVVSYPQEDETLGNDVDLQRVYDESRQRIRQTLAEFDAPLRHQGCGLLPCLPTYRENEPRAGLDDNLQWCDDAVEALTDVPARIDTDLITELIELLRHLRELPASQFPKIDEALFEKTRQRAQRVFDRLSTKNRRFRPIPFEGCRNNPRLQWAASVVAQLARTARDGPLQPLGEGHARRQISMTELHRHLLFYKAVERLYRLTDPQYVSQLDNLQKEIASVVDEMNRLDSTDSGRLVNAFDRLTSGDLQHLYEEVARTLDIDEIVASTMFGGAADQLSLRQPRESLTNKIIARLEDIQKEGEERRKCLAEGQANVESQTPSHDADKSGKESWLWKLYEKTLKIVLDAIIECVKRT